MNHSPALLTHDQIARRIPHQGRMCLLDSVELWDDTQIICRAWSHRASDHPLRAHGRLGAACGIEYAAQAMALHGALLAQAGAAPPGAGYLVGMRGVTLHVDRLDTLAGALTVRAERIAGDDTTVMYGFSLTSDDLPLLDGRATVVLDGSRAGAAPAPVGGPA